MSVEGELDEALALGSGVRRHHTITSASRPMRASAIAEETADDEPLGEEWAGPVGAVGDKSAGLHRQASLPTSKQHYRNGAPGQGRMPRHQNSLNSLGQEGDEEDWEKEMRGMHNQDELNFTPDPAAYEDDGSGNPSPVATNFEHGPSPPLADSGVRRHVSMTAGAGARRAPAASGLRRAGTVQATGMGPRGHASGRSPSPDNNEEAYELEEDPDAYAEDSYYASPGQPGQQQPMQPMQPMQSHPQGNGAYPGNRSQWGTQAEWRQGAPMNAAVDDVQRALANMELASGVAHGMQGSAMGGAPGPMYGAFPQAPPGQSAHPPRFNPAQPPPQQQPGGANLRRGGAVSKAPAGAVDQRKMSLYTDVPGAPGPASASAYLPPGAGVGGIPGGAPSQAHSRHGSERTDDGRERSYSAAGDAWGQKERVLGGRASNPNLNYAYGAQPPGPVPNVPSLPQQYMGQQQQQPRLGVATSFGQGVQGQVGGPLPQAQGQSAVTSPVDVPTLIATKGYNPVNFDIKPTFARYFVIKSYTEEDVHKSIKYEIWSSTDPGNKRLDKAFKETAGRGPIYLFFSVNASGHFCGMAEMLTPVDYTRSSTVWASDKWKGVFKVRWIFVRDIPNATLRHIKLNNTQERKPVTNSRDTQELLPDAGHEMLRIFHTHPARTSLLQDFSYYELQSVQKTQMTQTQSPPPVQAQARMQSPQPPALSPTLAQQHPFAMANPAALAYAAQQQGQMPHPQQLSPMLQHQMAQMGGLGAPGAYAVQGVMRHPSPGPLSAAGGQYMGMHGGGF